MSKANRTVKKRRPTAAGVARSSKFFGRILGLAIAAVLACACFFIGGRLTDSMAFAEKFQLAEAFQPEKPSANPDAQQGDDSKNDRHIPDNAEVNLKGETKWDHFRHVAQDALKHFGLDTAWSNTVLAMIRIESDGDIYVDDLQDIMQAKEGETDIVTDGIPGKCRGGTPESSIYAGVCELSHCISDFKEFLGRDPSPTNESDIALLTQGYNYGHRGWFTYLGNNGITEWSLEASEAYQSSVGGIGTANHGYKCQQAYKDFAGK